VRQPAPDGDLLLVAARKALHLALRAGVDLEPSTASATRAFSWRRRRGPSCAGGRKTAWRCSPARSVRGTAPRPGCRARSSAPRRWRRRGGGNGRACRRPRSMPAAGLRKPASTSKSSSCPWPSSATTPRTSPGCSSKLASVSFGAAARFWTAGAAAGGPGARGLRRRLPRSIFAPSIISTSAVLDARRDLGIAHAAPVAQDRGAVAELRDLGEAVGDVDHAAPVLGLLPRDAQHALHEVGGQGGGQFVQQQHVGRARQRAGEVDDPQRGKRQVADHRVEPSRDGRARPSSGGRSRRRCRPGAGCRRRRDRG
jgi:hypothetical protein